MRKLGYGTLPKAGLLMICGMLVSGCHHDIKTVPVNLDYARTSLGYRNSGLLRPGSLFLWDTQTNELVSLSSDVVLPEVKPNSKTSIEAKNIRGIEVGLQAELPSVVAGEIKAAIRNNYVFVVNNATRATSQKRYSAISKTYATLRQDGQDPYNLWRIDDLAGNSSRYKMVLAESPVYADSETLQFLSGGDGSIKIKSPANQDVTFTVKAPREDAAKCSGQPALCFINLFVLDVLLNTTTDQNGQTVQKLGYRPSSGVDREMLPEALRKLS